jgi:asparagine synthase (glutamine-hydrolysing)
MLQLVQRYPEGWVVSLGDRTPSRAGSKGASRIGFPYLTGVGTKSQRSTFVVDDPACAPPSIAEDASCKVIFDGVLYNRAELSERFAASSSLTANDAGLILQAYLHWGENMWHKVKGIFALLVWDGRRRTLLCTRDPLGVYPLFYTDTGRELLFSTSLDALVRHSDVSDAPNRPALVDHLCYRLEKREETFYEAINRVPAGHVMSIKGTSRQQYRYWDPVPDENEVNWIREDELERFDELLDQAVDRSLQLGRPGIFLSGGLDSVSVAAVAADITRRKGLPDPLALSLVFPHPECNEESVQHRVGLGLGLPQELIPLGKAAGPIGLLAAGMEMSSELPAPLYNVWAPAYQHLGLEGARQGCQVILTGGGGDEWLTVSPYYAADLFRSLDVGGLYRLWYSMQRSFPVSRRAFTYRLLWTFGTRPWVSMSARRALSQVAPGILGRYRRHRISKSTPGWVAPDPTLRRESEQRAKQFISSRGNPHGSFYFHEGRRTFDHPLIALEMEENFEVGRRTGLLQLMPYWDADLVDFLYRTPPELLNRGERSKALVRQTVARRFPGLNFERQRKVTALNFFTSLLLEEGARLWQMMGGAQALAELGIVDAQALDSTMPKLLSGTQPPQESHRIRDILLVEAWLRPRLGLPLPDGVEGELFVKR